MSSNLTIESAWIQTVNQQLLTIPRAIKHSLKKNGHLDVKKTVRSAKAILSNPLISTTLSEEIGKLALNERSINVSYDSLIKDNEQLLIQRLFDSVISPQIQKLEDEPTRLFLADAIQSRILAALNPEKKKPIAKEEKEEKINSNITFSLSEKLLDDLINTYPGLVEDKYNKLISPEIGEQVRNGFQFLYTHPESINATSAYIDLANAISQDTPGYKFILFKLLYEKMAELFSTIFPKIIQTEEFSSYRNEFTEAIFEAELEIGVEGFREKTHIYERMLIKHQSLA